MESVIRVSGIDKRFVTEKGQCVHALDNVSFNATANDFVCIVGPSGCGKSTLLRIIAGLEEYTAGSALYLDQPITAPHPQIGLVFQEYSLFPWRTVIENVWTGLEFAGRPRAFWEQSAREYLQLVGLETFAHAFPHELSGGMQQRVAIARSLATEPKVLLMDEPFGALDAYSRIVLQKELLRIWEQNRKTILFVTHSVDEAIFLADRILVMSNNPGRILEDIEVTMSRPRDRGNPSYGALAARILAKLEKEISSVI